MGKIIFYYLRMLGRGHNLFRSVTKQRAPLSLLQQNSFQRAYATKSTGPGVHRGAVRGLALTAIVGGAALFAYENIKAKKDEGASHLTQKPNGAHSSSRTQP